MWSWQVNSPLTESSQEHRSRKRHRKDLDTEMDIILITLVVVGACVSMFLPLRFHASQYDREQKILKELVAQFDEDDRKMKRWLAKK